MLFKFIIIIDIWFNNWLLLIIELLDLGIEYYRCDFFFYL